MPCATCWRLSWLFQAKLSFIDDEGRRAGITVWMIRGNATVKAHIERAVKDFLAETPIRGVVQAVIGLRVISSHILSYYACQLTPVLKICLSQSIPYSS